jgi:hypothetical protein
MFRCVCTAKLVFRQVLTVDGMCHLHSTRYKHPHNRFERKLLLSFKTCQLFQKMKELYIILKFLIATASRRRTLETRLTMGCSLGTLTYYAFKSDALCNTLPRYVLFQPGWALRWQNYSNNMKFSEDLMTPFICVIPSEYTSYSLQRKLITSLHTKFPLVWALSDNVDKSWMEGLLLFEFLNIDRIFSPPHREVILGAKYLQAWATSQYEGKGRWKERGGSKTPFALYFPSFPTPRLADHKPVDLQRSTKLGDILRQVCSTQAATHHTCIRLPARTPSVGGRECFTTFRRMPGNHFKICSGAFTATM